MAPPSFSPRAATVVYTSDGEIWRRDGHDGEPENLTRTEAPEVGAAVSPDGSRVLFQSLRSGDRDVWVMGIDGTDPMNLTRHPASDLLAEWTPDGERVLFFSTRGEEPGEDRPFPGHLWLVRADGTDLRRVTREPLSSSFGAEVSPDGRRVLTARAFGEDVALVEVDLVDGVERRLTGTGTAYGGRYSPDGTRIAFHRQQGQESRIVVADADGGNERELTSGAQHYAPAWSPDGLWLLVTAAPQGGERFDLIAVPIRGGEPVPVVATEADERYGRWVPAPGSSR